MKCGENLLDDPIAWGRKLIETEDHDPLYTMLVKGQDSFEDDDQRARWLFAYWCCYHPGVASKLSEYSGTSFWAMLREAAANKSKPLDHGIPVEGRWPRAAERRHWRGDKAIDMVDKLSNEFPVGPEAIVDRMMLLSRDRAVTLKEVENAVCVFPQFGPWIAFKIADMAERVWGRKVDFPANLASLYKDPRKGAEMASPLMKVSPGLVPTILICRYRDIKAPPLGDRIVNIQEVETVLCKWKSAVNGRYYIGADTTHYHEGMRGWGRTAHSLMKSLPAIPK